VLALGLLTGCGGTGHAAHAKTTVSAATAASPTPSPSSTGLEALSGPEVLKKAHDASTSARTVHVRGMITYDEHTIEIDATMVRGKGGSGQITLDGQSVKMTVLGTSAYLKAGKAYWTAMAGKDAASRLTGKYIKIPTSLKGFDKAVALLDFDKTYDLMFSAMSGLKVTVPTDINGVPAITLHVTDGSKIYVATEGKPYILRIASPKYDAEGLDFFDYDKKVTLKTPPADKVLDMSTMPTAVWPFRRVLMVAGERSGPVSLPERRALPDGASRAHDTVTPTGIIQMWPAT